MIVGIISDTHGLLRPEAVAALHDCDYLLHGGDVGKPGVLDQLEELAPVTAVRGNIDRGPFWEQRLPLTTAVELGGYWFYLIHILDELDLDPATAGMHAVIYGHSHQPATDHRDGVLYFNPGSAGPRRFHLPVTLAKIDLSRGLVPRLIHLL